VSAPFSPEPEKGEIEGGTRGMQQRRRSRQTLFLDEGLRFALSKSRYFCQQRVSRLLDS
jgi:hypothetical protein